MSGYMEGKTPEDLLRIAVLAERTADSFDALEDPIIEVWTSGEQFTTEDLRLLAKVARRAAAIGQQIDARRARVAEEGRA